MTNVKVSTRYRRYRYRKAIRRVLDSSARKQTFICEEDGAEITVEEFSSEVRQRLFQMIVRTDLGLEEYNIQLEEADSCPLLTSASQGNRSISPQNFVT